MANEAPALQVAADFAGVKRRFAKIASLLRRSPATLLEEYFVGRPATEQRISKLEAPHGDDDDDWSPFPDLVKSSAQVFDGARLSWRRRGRQHAKTGGEVRLFTLAEHQQEKTWGIDETCMAWPLLGGTSYADIVLSDGVRINFFEKYSGYWKGGAADYFDVINCALDHLGMPGWELSLYSDGLDTKEEVDALADCTAKAAEVWQLIAADVPPRLAKRQPLS